MLPLCELGGTARVDCRYAVVLHSMPFALAAMLRSLFDPSSRLFGKVNMQILMPADCRFPANKISIVVKNRLHMRARFLSEIYTCQLSVLPGETKLELEVVLWCFPACFHPYRNQPRNREQ